MCIRDRGYSEYYLPTYYNVENASSVFWQNADSVFINQSIPCLLYTSDAADERSSVDLGGRRIIKKKKIIHTESCKANK